MIIKGKPAGLYRFWYKGDVSYVGQSKDVVFRSCQPHYDENRNRIPFDERDYFLEDDHPYLSDQRYRTFFETQMIYRHRKTARNVWKPKELLDLNIFLEKVFLWRECPESAFLNFSSNYRPYATRRFFKDLSRWHLKGKNWIHNDYSFFNGEEWNPPYDITKPLYLDGELAFYALVEKGFQFDSSNKPWHVVTEVDLDKGTEKEKKEKLLLKKFAMHCRTRQSRFETKIGEKRAEEYEKILARKLHNMAEIIIFKTKEKKYGHG